MSRDRIEGGERPGVREAIGRHTEQLVKAGNPPEKAKAIATQAAIRHEQRNGVSINPKK